MYVYYRRQMDDHERRPIDEHIRLKMDDHLGRPMDDHLRRQIDDNEGRPMDDHVGRLYCLHFDLKWTSNGRTRKHVH